MNNDNSTKQLHSNKNEIQNNIQDSAIKKYNKNIQRNVKPKYELNLSDYFKLLKHKEKPSMKKKLNKKQTKKIDINKSHKSISNKSNMSNKSNEISTKNRKSCSNNIKQNKKEKNNSPDLDLKFMNNESEKIFNKRIIKHKMIKNKLPSTNNTTIKKTAIKKLIKNMSCKNFNNTKLKKIYDLEEIGKEKEEDLHNIGKFLVSSKYFEKVKFNRYKYYNINNNYYIDGRRQRIEDYLNKMIFEKYKVIKPLRMTERIFYKEEDEKTNKEQNDINISNNLFYSDYNRQNKYFKDINNFLFNESSNYNGYNNTKLPKNKNLTQYYKNIKKISNSRKNLMIDNYFDTNRKEYSLLDFNFSLFHRNKSKKNKNK